MSSEGVILAYEIEDLDITTQMIDEENDENSGEESEWEKNDQTVFIFPTTVAHRIDKDSPFYEWGPKDILNSRFEMLVTLEGIVEPTGNSVQSRSSYLPNEILWGHHYESMVSYEKKRGTYVVDCSNLNAVVSDNTPLISVKRQEEKAKLDKKAKEANGKLSNGNSTGTPNHVSRVQVDSPAMTNSTDTIPTISPTPTCTTDIE